MQRNTRRVMSDFENLVKEGPENEIWIKQANPDNLDLFYIMVRGPEGPYHGTLFFFTLEPWTSFYATENANNLTYPASPPKILHQSPWSIRSHPNLYHTGGDFVEHTRVGGAKVCLSILGTWEGPKWSAMYKFMHIFQTIRSILDNEPLRNEPAYTNNRGPVVQAYSKYVQYVTLRETFERLFLPVLSGKIPDNAIYLKLFKDEIQQIWTDHKKWYLDHAARLESVNTVVHGAHYGDRSYMGEPYKFKVIDLLKDF
jgi:ubiquitin-protein ligase